MELEFEMEYTSTGSLVANEVKKYSYEEVFGHPQPDFYKKEWKRRLDRDNKARELIDWKRDRDKKAWKKEREKEQLRHPADGEFDWKTLHPGFMPVQSKKRPPEITYWNGFFSTTDELKIVTTGSIGRVCINPCTEIKIISEGKIGMGMDDPRENLHITEPFDVSKHFEKNIGMGISNPTAVLDITGINGRSPKQALKIVDKEFFTEELKALHYDLERAKDQAAHDKLIDDFKRLWNPSSKFFDKKWDLTKKLSDKSTDYSDYAEFLEEYFDEGDK